MTEEDIFYTYKRANGENCTKPPKKENRLVANCNLLRNFIARKLQQNCGFCAFFRICSFIVLYDYQHCGYNSWATLLQTYI